MNNEQKIFFSDHEINQSSVRNIRRVETPDIIKNIRANILDENREKLGWPLGSEFINERRVTDVCVYVC